MTGKERAEWRKQANTLSAIFQIGKDNITPPLIEAVDAALPHTHTPHPHC